MSSISVELIFFFITAEAAALYCLNVVKEHNLHPGGNKVFIKNKQTNKQLID